VLHTLSCASGALLLLLPMRAREALVPRIIPIPDEESLVNMRPFSDLSAQLLAPLTKRWRKRISRAVHITHRVNGLADTPGASLQESELKLLSAAAA
jgi:hypothetical protein